MNRSEENAYEEVLVKKLDAMLRDLGEHFDAVQILGTFVDDEGNTGRLTRGVGNWYARQGVAREFLEMDAAQTTAFEFSKVLGVEERPDDGDGWRD